MPCLASRQLRQETPEEERGDREERHCEDGETTREKERVEKEVTRQKKARPVGETGGERE
jgi:hypothetical protein